MNNNKLFSATVNLLQLWVIACLCSMFIWTLRITRTTLSLVLKCMAKNGIHTNNVDLSVRNKNRFNNPDTWFCPNDLILIRMTWFWLKLEVRLMINFADRNYTKQTLCPLVMLYKSDEAFNIKIYSNAELRIEGCCTYPIYAKTSPFWSWDLWLRKALLGRGRWTNVLKNITFVAHLSQIISFTEL